MFQKNTLTWTGYLLLAWLAVIAYPVMVSHIPMPATAVSDQDWAAAASGITLLGLVAFLYARGWNTMHRQHNWPTRRLRNQAYAFTASMAVLVTAMLAPLTGLADHVLWTHVIQHALVALLAAPLLMLAAPLPALLLGLPGPLQRRLGQGWNSVHRLNSLIDRFRNPLAAWLLQLVLLWAWHTPALAPATHQGGLNWLENISLFISALLLWI